MSDHEPAVTRRHLLRLAGAGAAVAATGSAAADADAGGPPDSSPRPGPDALYGENPTPPLLETGGGWRVDPLLVAGAEAHVDGEYLYQDYVLDDRGADTTEGPAPPGTPTGDYAAPTDLFDFAPPTGDYVYPRDPDRYGFNAADLLEFRARPTAEGVAYRITLNTMLEPDAAAVAIGIDTSGDGSTGDTDWGYGLGNLGAPADHVLVTWGEGAELDGEPLDADRVSVDVERNQIEVEVPLAPGDETWRHYCVTGLWNDGRSRRIAAMPDEQRPGGAHPESPGATPPVFNVAFRFDEPRGFANTETDDPLGELRAVREREGSRQAAYGAWHEHAQARALAERDISRFYADVDFGKLRRRGTDRSGVPDSGVLTLLYPSRYPGEGVDATADEFQGRMQPYAAYVPEGYDGSPTPVTLFMHSLGFNHAEYAVYMPDLLAELGEERDSIVFTPEARGPDGWYQRRAELATFEAFRDLRTRFAVDMDRVTLGGYSMGGYGTFKLAAQYPDLFARGFSVVGPPDEEYLGGPTNGRSDAGPKFTADPENAMRITDNLRHVPLLMWVGSNDELVPLAGPLNYRRQLADHGYRHELATFAGYDHFTFGVEDDWAPAGEFLDGATVERAPARVTYRRVPDFDHPDLGLVHDGAYWVDDIEPRETGDGASALVDAVSLADGYADPVASAYREPGTEPSTHTKQGVEWVGDGPERAAANALDVTLEGVASATLWIAEAGLDAEGSITLRVESDGPATLTLRGPVHEATVDVPAGASTRTVDLR